jgi:hypothetical protein
MSRALPAAEKRGAEGGGAFNPRIKPLESSGPIDTEGAGAFRPLNPAASDNGPSGPEVCSSAFSLEIEPFSAACLAHEEWFPLVKVLKQGFVRVEKPGLTA